MMTEKREKIQGVFVHFKTKSCRYVNYSNHPMEWLMTIFIIHGIQDWLFVCVRLKPIFTICGNKKHWSSSGIKSIEEIFNFIHSSNVKCWWWEEVQDGKDQTEPTTISTTKNFFFQVRFFLHHHHHHQVSE